MKTKFGRISIFTVCFIAILLGSSCKNPSASEDASGSGPPSVWIGAQSGVLPGSAIGFTTFPVATANCANGSAGTITWFTSYDGSTAAGVPKGITASASAVVGNAATISITTAATSEAGSYYIKLSIGSTSSAVASLTLSTPTYLNLLFDANGGTGSIATQVIMIDDTITLPINSFTAPTGSQFAGWASSSIMKVGTTYADKASFRMGSSNATLYAIWLPSSAVFTISGNDLTLSSYGTKTAGAVVIPSGVTIIDGSAFALCSGISSLAIPPSVTSLGFMGFVSVPAITVETENLNYSSDAAGVLFDKKKH